MIYRNKLTRTGLPLLAASALTFPFSSQTEAALVTIDSPALLHLHGSATARWDDNIFLAPNNEESDVIFIFSPGLELNLGARANANINIYYRHDFHLYVDNSDLDGNYANVFLESYWTQPRLDLRFDASFQQLAQADPTFRLPGVTDRLIERDHSRANLRGEYELTERTSIASGLNYTRVDFDTPGFSNRDTIGIPINVYYALTPKVDVSAGYRFRHTDSGSRQPLIGFDPNTGPIFGAAQSVPNYRDHYYNLGVRGEVAPKLIGEARAGYQQRQVRGESNVSGPSFGLDFSHFTTPKTTLTAGIYRDFETGGRGSSITATGGSLGARHTFSHLVAAFAGVNYYERKWDRGIPADIRPDRKDETLDLNVGVTYSPNVYVDLTAGYIFRTNDSNEPAFEFDNNIISLSAALRY